MFFILSIIHIIYTYILLYIVRMPNTRLPKRLFYGELTEGKRSQGGQKKAL